MHRTFAEPLKACCCLLIGFSIRLIAYFGFLYSSLLLQLLFVALWCSELLIRCWHRFLLPKMPPKCPPGPPQTPPGHPKTLSEWPLGLPKTTLSGVLDHLWGDVRCRSCIFCIFFDFFEFLGPNLAPFGEPKGHQNGPEIDQNSRAKFKSEKVASQERLGAVFVRFPCVVILQNRAGAPEKHTFLKNHIFTPDAVLEWFLIDSSRISSFNSLNILFFLNLSNMSTTTKIGDLLL